MSKRRRIGFLTLSDPKNRRIWSGTPYYMGEALQRNCGDVIYLGPIRTYLTGLGKLLNKVCVILFGRKYDYTRSSWYAWRVCGIARKRIAAHRLDCIVAPAASIALANLRKPEIPILYVSDTTFAMICDYYDSFSDYLAISVRAGNAKEKAALQLADIVSFPSQWAADSAIRDYGISPEKVHVIPFGANLDVIPPKKVALNRERSGECRLLFIGVDWVRKGGDIAFQVLLSLECRHGIKAHLTVCGCNVPDGVIHERLTSVGFLDKRDCQQADQLSQLFRETDYLLLPTRNDCYGVVFCEASAYGVPSISTDTGGVSGAVKEGANGFLFPEASRGEDYADLIADIEADSHRYKELCLRSRQDYDTRVNWDVWAQRVGSLFDKLQA